MKKPFYQLEQMQDIVRQFTPNWFTVSMGTGVVALILAELPFAHSLMVQLGASLWQLNILLFMSFCLLYGLRWLIYPTEAKQIFSHASMSLFLGAIPMALATIINGLLKFGISLYGDGVIQLAQMLWYVDVLLAVAIAWLVPFCMFSRQEHQLHSMTAV